MAFLKFSRDKRGYENFYLVQPSNRGKARPRVLYWFRTPPNIKVGRLPFDPEIRRALEAQNPDVVFDWETIVHTPIPPPTEPERWRERRRLERTLRAAEAEEGDSTVDGSAPSSIAESLTPPAQAIEEPEPAAPVIEVGEPQTTAEPVGTSNSLSPASAVATEGGTPRQGRRRRRRRGRRKEGNQGSGFTGSASTVQGSRVESSEEQKPESGTVNPEPGTLNPEPRTLNPDPDGEV